MPIPVMLLKGPQVRFMLQKTLKTSPFGFLSQYSCDGASGERSDISLQELAGKPSDLPRYAARSLWSSSSRSVVLRNTVTSWAIKSSMLVVSLS